MGSPTALAKTQSSATRYVFMGRLVSWKSVDLLLAAFKQAAAQASITLTIVGEGGERAGLEQQARELGILSDAVNQPGKVFFAGWRSQQECAVQLQQADALVLPSLLECGGSVVLEAMGKAGRRKAVTCFDWEQKVDRMIEIYRQVIANNAAKLHKRSRQPLNGFPNEKPVANANFPN